VEDTNADAAANDDKVRVVVAVDAVAMTTLDEIICDRFRPALTTPTTIEEVKYK